MELYLIGIQTENDGDKKNCYRSLNKYYASV